MPNFVPTFSLKPWDLQMSDDIENVVIDTVIIETIATLPRLLLDHYRNLPGRRPSEAALRVSAAILSLEEKSASEIITAVVDSTVFAILYTIESNFKDMAIETKFARMPANIVSEEMRLTERYRMKVDPCGLIKAQVENRSHR